MGKATDKQMWYLNHNNLIPANSDEVSYEKASELIGDHKSKSAGSTPLNNTVSNISFNKPVGNNVQEQIVRMNALNRACDTGLQLLKEWDVEALLNLAEEFEKWIKR